MQSMITKYLHNDSKNEIKLYLVLGPILMLLFGMGLGAIIGASGGQFTMSLFLTLLWTVAVPLVFIGYVVHKTFQKIDAL
ncbi:hypothetical protein [Flavobacterium sp. W21_SRS_FM6]|uniref:hypothetical protein n=1 Tax=Flavobacterium sp. W21_SRS_FM6 TaxID=3240268 RepID=UPI003F8F058D